MQLGDVTAGGNGDFGFHWLGRGGSLLSGNADIGFYQNVNRAELPQRILLVDRNV